MTKKKENNTTAIGAGSPSTGFPRTMGSNVYTAKKYPELLGKSPEQVKTKKNGTK